MGSASTDAAAAAAANQTVYLVRHAESENNVSKAAYRDSLKRLRLPTWTQTRAMAPMALFPMDTELSEEGRRQVAEQRRRLDEADFAAASGIQLVVHSPLIRAKNTCVGLFGDTKAPIVEHSELYERSKWEHLRPSAIVPRVARFVGWLQARDERRVAVVGHSSFFREMTGGVMLDNCSVWRFTLTTDGAWEDSEQMFPRPA